MRTFVLGAMLLALTSLACDTNVAPLKSNVQVSFATRGPGTAPAPARAPAVWQAVLNDTLTDSTNAIVITRALMVLSQIELSQAQGAGCATLECEIAVGPVLVDLPLVHGAQLEFAVTVPVGTYSEVDFEVHKVTMQDPPALRDVMLNRSIHVEGTFNGEPFTFESELDAEQELVMSPPVAIADTSATNITIRVALDAWFQSANGGGLLDPRDVANRSTIEEAIKVSLQAFKDDDHDGQIDP